MGRQVTVCCCIAKAIKTQPSLKLQADISEDDYMHNLTTEPFMPSKCHRLTTVFMLSFLLVPFFFLSQAQFFPSVSYFWLNVIYSYEIILHFYKTQVTANDAWGFAENINSWSAAIKHACSLCSGCRPETDGTSPRVWLTSESWQFPRAPLARDFKIDLQLLCKCTVAQLDKSHGFLFWSELCTIYYLGRGVNRIQGTSYAACMATLSS